MIRIGIDFGGTKIEAAAIGTAGQIVHKIRTANPGRYEDAILTVRQLIAAMEQQVGARCTVGICTPGSISPTTGLMRNSNSLYLNGRRFREDLSSATDRPIRMANDANCFALSEAVDGAGAGGQVVFGIILGTGCGGGLVVNRRLIDGHNGIAGEWGHNPLPWPSGAEMPGPTCYCGQAGCLEQWISGTGLSRDYLKTTGDNLSAEAIIEGARLGDIQCAAAFDRLIDRIGRALASVCNLLDPDAIVVGGGLSNVGELYQRLPGAITPRIFSDAWNSRILPAKWGDSSGVRGAARLWPPPGEMARPALKVG